MVSASLSQGGKLNHGIVNKSIVELFDRQCAINPNATAVIFKDRSLSYRELNKEAYKLTCFLQEMGCEAGSIIALCVERSLKLVISVLAILKMKATYLPIDPQYPKDRIGFILKDSKATHTIISSDYIQKFPHDVEIINIDQWFNNIDENKLLLQDDLIDKHSLDYSDPHDLAYINYTSGSTGLPKGVEITHRSVVNLVQNQEFARLNNQMVTLQLSPPAFDAFTFDLWAPLLNGGTCVLFPEKIPLLRSIGKTIKKYQVNTAFITSSLFNAMIDEDLDALQGMQQVLVGGEALSVSHIRRAIHQWPSIEFINGYGPTECTTFSTFFKITLAFIKQNPDSIPIGYPLNNVQLFVLDENAFLVEKGTEGELCIAGHGVARGYLNNPALTAQKFVEYQSKEGLKRVYRTGDRVCENADGTIEYLGRIDHQVKISGYRIEIGEIEAHLLECEGIQQAAVVVEESQSSKNLVAFIVTKQNLLNQDIKAHLAKKLPTYMIPMIFHKIEALPLTENGKLDRKSLLSKLFNISQGEPYANA